MALDLGTNLKQGTSSRISTTTTINRAAMTPSERLASAGLQQPSCKSSSGSNANKPLQSPKLASICTVIWTSPRMLDT